MRVVRSWWVAFVLACSALAAPVAVMAPLAGCVGAQRAGSTPCPCASPASSGGSGASGAKSEGPSSAGPAGTEADARGSTAADPSFLRTYAATRGFRLGTPRDALPTPDGKAVVFLRSSPRDPKQSLHELDLESGETRELLSPAALAHGPEVLTPEEKARRERMRVGATGFTAFELSPDGKRILVSISGRLFVVERASKALVELRTGEGAAIDPRFSPDGASVAYVRDGDLRVVPSDGTGKERSLTTGATADVTHGLAEFVAQEELERRRGYWWSPDSKRVLYEEADTSKVERLALVDLARPEAPPVRPPYPRAGKANAEVRFGIVAAGGGKTTWIRWDRARFPYVARVTWSKGAKPSMYVLDRAQRSGQLLAVDDKTGATKILVEEHDDAWLDVDPSVPCWLPDGSGFLWSSERDGELRLELRDASGKLLRPLGPAALGYRELLHVDPKRRVAHVAAAADPTERGMVTLPLDGGAPVSLSPAGGVAPAPYLVPRFGDAHDVFVTYAAGRDGKRRWLARSVDGARVHEIPSIAETPPSVNVEWTIVGDDAYRVAIVRPRGFVAGRRYPVLDAAYAGPHVNVVTADGSSYVREQWLADALDAIVVRIDAKGTPHRGRAWSRALKHALHEVPLAGHVAALHALAGKVPEIDLARVGVVGWSFGGYFASLSVLARPDVYKVGVAGAPVVDWRDYDTAYTERYLGDPQSNAKVYDAADASTWAKRPITGDAPARPLLVFHGTADDNVFFSSSMKLVQALATSGRPFTFVPLAGQTHMLSTAEANEIVWGRTVEFLRTHL